MPIKIGNSTVSKIYVGSTEIDKIYVGENKVYERSTPVSTISFAIDNVSYQAESGMTWSEWISSAYNTGGFDFGLADDYIHLGSSSNMIVGYIVCDFMETNDIIVANHNYAIFNQNSCN